MLANANSLRQYLLESVVRTAGRWNKVFPFCCFILHPEAYHKAGCPAAHSYVVRCLFVDPSSFARVRASFEPYLFKEPAYS